MYSTKRVAELKALGFLLQNDKEHFAVRFLSKAGNMTAEEMVNVAHIAKKYGRGYMGFTTRLSVEVPWIHGDDVDALIVSEQTILNSYITAGQLLYGEISFNNKNNARSDMIQGDFTFDTLVTNTPPAKSITQRVKSTSKGIENLYTEEDE